MRKNQIKTVQGLKQAANQPLLSRPTNVSLFFISHPHHINFSTYT